MKKFNIFDSMASKKSEQGWLDDEGDAPSTDAGVVSMALVPCDYCERTFSADRIKKHLEART